jgi:hypothetical protein
MSVTTRVVLDPARMPSPAAWAREIRARGFAMDLDEEFDPPTFSGFLPCVHQGHASGFEYGFEPDPEIEAELRQAAGATRTLEITFVTHSDLRELVTAWIAAGALALLTDGVVWSDESGECLSGSEALAIARDTERELNA